MSWLTSVLLSAQNNAWQITDFGLTEEGVSGLAYHTGHSRGTQGYRGPELLKEEHDSIVCQPSDVFALGCTLFELAAGKKLFPRDYNVWDYERTNQRPQNPDPKVDSRTRAYVPELLNAMLALDPWKRPAARDILKELGGDGEDWYEVLTTRMVDLQYPSSGSEDWQLMRWIPQWYVTARRN